MKIQIINVTPRSGTSMKGRPYKMAEVEAVVDVNGVGHICTYLTDPDAPFPKAGYYEAELQPLVDAATRRLGAIPINLRAAPVLAQVPK